MSAKTKDLSSRIQTLQERLEEENKTRDHVDLAPFSSPKLGSGRRPSNRKIHIFFLFRLFALHLPNQNVQSTQYVFLD